MKRHGRWRSDTAKDGYVDDSLEKKFFITKKLKMRVVLYFNDSNLNAVDLSFVLFYRKSCPMQNNVVVLCLVVFRLESSVRYVVQYRTYVLTLRHDCILNDGIGIR